MARFLTGLFGGNVKQQQQPATTLRVMTSLQGVAIPVLLGGQNRLPGHLIWMGGFASSGGSTDSGKGSLFSDTTSTTSITYSVDCILAVCEGPATISGAFVNGASSSLIGTDFSGSYTQDVWGFLSASFPSKALAYRGICYAAYAPLSLGTDPSIPQLTYEVSSNSHTYALAGAPDANPKDCWVDFLTEAHWGVGFPAARLDTALTSWSNYCLALGLVVSPLIESPVQASAFLSDMLTATNSQAVWSNGVLTVVPYGDASISGTGTGILTTTENWTIAVTTAPVASIYSVSLAASFIADLGVTYVDTGVALTSVPLGDIPAGQYTLLSAGIYKFSHADVGRTVAIHYSYSASGGTGVSFAASVAPIYDFTTYDFLPNKGSIGSGTGSGSSPVTVVRKQRNQMLTTVKVEYLNRANRYNPATIEYKDEAAITAFRERPSSVRQMHMFCLSSAAQQSAMLQLIREQIPRTFQFTVGKQFILLDPTDIVAITVPGQNLTQQPVRITEIQENDDSSLTMTAEEWLGTASAPLYSMQNSVDGFASNVNVDPGPVNP